MTATIIPFPGTRTPSAGPGPTVADLLAYYVAEVLPTKAPTTQYQRGRFLALLNREYGHLPLTALDPPWLRVWRDQLSRRLKPDSVRQYLDTVSAVLTVACNELGRPRGRPRQPGTHAECSGEERRGGPPHHLN
jgi:hypothetical protein